MIVHEAVGKQTPAEISNGIGEQLEKGPSILVIKKDRSFLHPAVVDVVKSLFEQNPGRSRHDYKIY
jgi:hypothetical protein